MIPLPLYPIDHHFQAMETLEKEPLPKELARKNRIFSKGELCLYRGKGIEKLVTLRVKGLHMYHYDFGIAYPPAEVDAPLFMYQVIVAPKRALALVHYPHWDIASLADRPGLRALFIQEKEYKELFIKDFKPQEFLTGDVIANEFNGLVRTTDVDKVYQGVTALFKVWHRELEQSKAFLSEEALDCAMTWKKDFTQRFYQKDYGYTATKRYLGERWAKKAFEEVLFTL